VYFVFGAGCIAPRGRSKNLPRCASVCYHVKARRLHYSLHGMHVRPYSPIGRVIRAGPACCIVVLEIVVEICECKNLHRSAPAHSTISICAAHGTAPPRNINPCSHAIAVENLNLRQGAAPPQKGQNTHCRTLGRC
jgi:hypothetical protein